MNCCANLNLSAIERIEVGRELGSDYANFGMTPPLNAPDSVREGFIAANSSRRWTRSPDRFVRKWLQLRLGALVRGRTFSPEVTVDFLRAIDQDKCPILLVGLTHATQSDTDWSIDRLNNDGAYACGNLAVISTAANQAKGALCYEDVRARSRIVNSVDGLSPTQWLRMACVMYGACHCDPSTRREWLPLATFIPNQSTWSIEAALQDTLLKASANSTQMNALLRRLAPISGSSDESARLKAIIERIHRLSKGLEHRYDALLDDSVQAQLKIWYLNIGPLRRESLRALVLRIHGGDKLSHKRLDTWEVPMRGYSSPRLGL